ncbi:aryl-sulfate sulfotransferase [Edwardsiella ictaluri]|nr:aryl-sulfate sulfotransferase [Edwardsiella ictaluri]ARD40290.1 aryl-sulfate sulfotransferase [Edwardsiella ictaluri]AVZ81723.1 aryl-sulfate sulfotransferase [Edwardsiella ictaluri]EKS7763094.1 aryl-sulfate sulfotransferase [Edwardsiella ictaluri]EKS7773524.1 aryl-sulfate sulfotransferase [Edwardsiella ictaluri]EKS7776605.1 aryl-sulfate sulfotransferase [Edwardsiella ictaluri]
MLSTTRKTLVAGAIAFAIGAISPALQAAGMPAAPAVGNFGSVVVDPYGNSPLTALINLNGHAISDVKVTVLGKGENGVAVSYPVGKQSLLTYDGIPIFGLYQKHDNQVTIEYIEAGKRKKDSYTIRTSAIVNKYMDNRSLTDLQQVKPVKVAKGFEDRLYLVNTHTFTPQGSDLHWSGEKDKNAGLLDANPATGSMPFDIAPFTFIVDTQGEYRWWLNQDALYNAHDVDVNKRGYLMGIRETPRGTFTAVQGQRWYEFDMMGQVLNNHRLPRGYLDATHESVETPNDTVLLRVGKRNYVREDGQRVHTIRDHILEVDKSGRVVDVWDLNLILDPLRDSLLGALDAGAVCVNVDLDQAGKQAKLEPDTPFGDALGVGPGRNWAHVNSIAYDPKDDSIILSSRHQGVVKIGRDKQVKWILAPSEGWNEKLSAKLLKPVDAQNKPLNCSAKGVCENSDFDFAYTQHTAWLSPKGTLTVFDNGDGRHLEQPALPTMKYSRIVEYKIDEKNMTVQQVWEYGKDRGYEWYNPITSIVEYQPDRDTMFSFGGSTNLFEPGQPTTGRLNEIDYKTKDVKVELDVLSDKANQTHYRAALIRPQGLFL